MISAQIPRGGRRAGQLRPWRRGRPTAGSRTSTGCRRVHVRRLVGEHVQAVSYGERHEDLASFLRSLRGADRGPGGKPDAARPAVAALDCRRRRCASAGMSWWRRWRPRCSRTRRSRWRCWGRPGIGKSTVCLAALHDDKVPRRFDARCVRRPSSQRSAVQKQEEINKCRRC
jgi:hypothetical protein